LSRRVFGRGYDARGVVSGGGKCRRLGQRPTAESHLPAILQSNKDRAGTLENVEASALCYLIAFDLDRFEVAYSRGTEYPGVGWSDRVTAKMKNPALPGPDGIGSVAPLISTGLIAPEDGRRTVAAFTGGFKRSHGAFRYGDLSLRNHGSHYGFIENGVVFSKLQPGLATILMLNDGSLEMKTWTEADDRQLAQIRYARQNGVPLAEFDPASQSTLPAAWVTKWGPGNWSGSEDDRLRTIRGGAALQESALQGGKPRRFLIYAVFSTPRLPPWRACFRLTAAATPCCST